MLLNTRIIKSRYVSMIIPICLVGLFFIFLNSFQTVKLETLPASNVEAKKPGDYLKTLRPNKTSYCKLNFGLPTQLDYNAKSDVSSTPELGKKSPFSILYNVIEGKMRQDEPGVTYVTQLTKDFVLFIPEVVRYWEGPISVAAFIPDDDPSIILESFLHFCYCTPDMSRLSLHLVFRKDIELNFSLSNVMPPKACDIRDLSKKNVTSGNALGNSDDVKKNTLESWYPINVLRNAARQAAYTEFVLVCDIELMPSQGLASRFLDMTESYQCNSPECGSRVYVVPVFEVDSALDVPRTKKQLIHLMSTNKAVYFHQLVCSHCQKFPGLEQWKLTDSGDIIKPLFVTKRQAPFHRWEPIYIGTKSEPLYNEELSWEGFQDKMLQMLEMCLADYKVVILDGAFLCHWPGMKRAKRKDEPWRLPYVKANQEHYDVLLKKILGKYPANPQCKPA